MNQIVRSIDFELGPGNPGAVAVFLHGAQGSTVQDVTVRMTDALAGFGGGGGAGASHLNIAAIGGQFGVRFDESEETFSEPNSRNPPHFDGIEGGSVPKQWTLEKTVFTSRENSV